MKHEMPKENTNENEELAFRDNSITNWLHKTAIQPAQVMFKN